MGTLTESELYGLFTAPSCGIPFSLLYIGKQLLSSLPILPSHDLQHSFRSIHAVVWQPSQATGMFEAPHYVKELPPIFNCLLTLTLFSHPWPFPWRILKLPSNLPFNVHHVPPCVLLSSSIICRHFLSHYVSKLLIYKLKTSGRDKGYIG